VDCIPYGWEAIAQSESTGRRSTLPCPEPTSLDTQRKLDGNRGGDTPIGLA
jgi:hypothetical protein